MIDEREIREMLQRRADTVPAAPADTTKAVRRAHRRLALNGALATAAALAIAVATLAGFDVIRTASTPADGATPTPPRSVDLGIFAPVEGRIVYGDAYGIWGVDPAAVADRSRVRLTSAPGTPIGWSSDGTRLLIMQTVRDGTAVSDDWDSLRLVVLDADGSEIQVTELPRWFPGAALSPDGSRVVFATYQALYIADVGGGRPVVLRDGGEDTVYAPTFSPDGSEIAFVVGSGDHSHRIWVMGSDGTGAHQILANETTMGAGHVRGLEWSPAGDLIALGTDDATYVFAPDGSGFTQVTARGTRPYWSGDGSQLAYSATCIQHADGCGLVVANADGSDAQQAGYAESGPWHPAMARTA